MMEPKVICDRSESARHAARRHSGEAGLQRLPARGQARLA